MSDISDIQQAESIEALIADEVLAVAAIRRWTNDARTRLHLPVRDYSGLPKYARLGSKP